MGQFLKSVAEIAFAEMHSLGDLLHGQPFFEMLLQIDQGVSCKREFFLLGKLLRLPRVGVVSVEIDEQRH